MIKWRWIILLFALIVDAEGREAVDLIIVVECVHRFQLGAKPANPTEGVEDVAHEMMVKLFRKRKSMHFAVIVTDDKEPQEAMNFRQGDDPFTLRYSVAGWKIFEPMVNTPIDDPLTDAVNKATRPDRGDRPEVPNGVFFFGVGDPPRTTDNKPIFDQPWMSKVDAVFFLVSGFQLPTELCYRNMHSSEGMCSQFDEPTDAPEEMLDDLDKALDEMGSDSTEEGPTDRDIESTHTKSSSHRTKKPRSTTTAKKDDTPPKLEDQSPESARKKHTNPFPIWVIIVIVVVVVLAILIVAVLIGYFAVVEPRRDHRRRHMQSTQERSTKGQQRSMTERSRATSMNSTYTTTGTYMNNTGTTGRTNTYTTRPSTTKPRGTQKQ